MTTQRRQAPATTQAPPRPPAPAPQSGDIFGDPVDHIVPDEIEAEVQTVALARRNAATLQANAERARDVKDVAHMVAATPDKVEAFLTKIDTAMRMLEDFSIRRTDPKDWTLFKDKAGLVVAVLRSSGALKVRKLLGISIFNYRPLNAQGIAEPLITKDTITPKPEAGERPQEQEIQVAEMWADAVCERTGETVQDVYFGLRSRSEEGRENFVGRGHRQDLKAACRTGVDTKAVRLLAGLSKVSIERLQEAKIDTDKCYKGPGWGTSQDRTARGVAETGGDFEERKKRLWTEILKRVGGDEAAAKDVLKEITLWQGSNGPMWAKSVDQFTQEWKLEKAEKALAGHARFGGALPPLKPAAAAGKAAPKKTDSPATNAPGREPGEDE